MILGWKTRRQLQHTEEQWTCGKNLRTRGSYTAVQFVRNNTSTHKTSKKMMGWGHGLPLISRNLDPLQGSYNMQASGIWISKASKIPVIISNCNFIKKKRFKFADRVRTFWMDSQAAWEITEDRNKDTAKEFSWDPDAQQPRLEIVLQGEEGERHMLRENTSSTPQSSLAFHPHADTARSRNNSEKPFSKKLFKH